MADNITVKNGAGSDVVLGAKDLSSVFLPKHIIVDDNGDIALVSVANAALAENAAKFLQTASVAFALDDAASAGSQAVPLEVESTAAPNLKVGVFNGTDQMPAGDAAARGVYVNLTDGTDTAAIDDVDSALDERTDGYVLSAAALHAIDSAASAGSKVVQLKVESTAQPNLRVAHWNAGVAMPAGASASTPIFVTPAANTSSGGSVHTTNGLDDTVTAVKASAGTIYSIVVTNTHSATQYLQVFNTAAGSVTLGTTAPVITVAVPSGETVVVNLGPTGATFGTAIAIAATTTATGSTAATASTMNCFVSYK